MPSRSNGNFLLRKIQNPASDLSNATPFKHLEAKVSIYWRIVQDWTLSRLALNISSPLELKQRLYNFQRFPKTGSKVLLYPTKWNTYLIFRSRSWYSLTPPNKLCCMSHALQPCSWEDDWYSVSQRLRLIQKQRPSGFHFSYVGKWPGYFCCQYCYSLHPISDITRPGKLSMLESSHLNGKMPTDIYVAPPLFFYH